MKKVQNFVSIFGALFLLCGPIFAEEKQLPAIHFSSTDIENVEEAQPKSEAQPESESQTQEPYEQPVETVAFNGITPSKTTVKELHEMLGEPAKVQKDGMGKGIDVEEYKIDGFKGVNFHIMGGKVFGVIAEFPESVNARKLAADLGMEHIQSVFLTNEKGVIQGEIFPEIGVAYAYDPSQKLGTIEEMQKDPKSVPMNVIQLVFQPVGPEPFLLRAETWVDIDQKRAYKDVLQALKLDPKNKQALAYKKVLEDAVPTLKDEVKLKADEPKKDGAEKDESMLETLTPPPLESLAEDADESNGKDATASKDSKPDDLELEDAKPEESKPEKSKSEGAKTEDSESVDLELEDPSEIHELNPPDVDSLTGEAGKKGAQTDEKSENMEAKELPQSLDLEEIKDDSKKETTEAPKVGSNAKPSTESAGGNDLPGSAEEKEEDSTLDFPNEISENLEKLNKIDAEKPRLSSKDQPVLSFEDELFQKVENLAQTGKFQESQDLLMEIRKRFVENPFVSFRANLVEGDIWMILPTPDAEEAFNCHRIAAEQGEKLLEGKVYQGRKYPLTKEEKRRVKLFLLDVWLGAATDLVLSSSEEKKDCVKWIEKVTEAMKGLLPEEVDNFSWEDTNLCYKTSYRTLSILLKLGDEQKIAEEVKRHLAITMKMLTLAKNSTEYFNICQKTSLLLDDASTIMILKGYYETAKEYLDQSIKFMEQVKSHRKKIMVQEEFLLAQLYYHRGQVIVLEAKKLSEDEKIQAHEEALEWYEKALPVLLEVVKTREWKDLLQLGKIMNGMSVSYAKLGNSQKALILLKTCIFCLEQYVENNPDDAIQLQVPYKNTIRILNYLDQKEEAEEIQRKMDDLNL